MDLITKACLVPIIFYLGIAIALFVEPPGEREQGNKDVRTRVALLIRQLGSEQFSEREAAFEALVAIGEPALRALRKAAEDSDDAEIRRQAQKLLTAIPAAISRGYQVHHYQGPEIAVSTMTISPGAQFVFSASGEALPGIIGPIDHTLRLWELKTGKELLRLKGHAGRVGGVSFSADGRRALSCGFEGDDGDILLWDLASGKMIRRLTRLHGLTRGACFSPNGKLVVSIAGDTMQLWDVETGREILAFERGGGNEVTFFPDGRRVLASSRERMICVFDRTTGKRCQQFEETWSYPQLTLSPDGARVLVSGDKGPRGSAPGQVELWGVEGGKLLTTFKGHTNLVGRMAFSPDGRRALTASIDGDIRLWDLKSGDQLRFFRSHTPIVLCVAFTPDGQFALSGHPDNTVVKWALPK